ncbi:hypothetical protein [Streptomyces albipurpureus]|uniref:PRC-barrel domain-containing protein n=1 Tax=Streptomyces albipurpureus TaxID=2897419 RepID=A0ABT0URS2_9ACTN|nr:hypothetical protein [Streptomyces sp. CWNU-1]MCM2391037.1 hypothetical protein [Streptomyces sp. CWNU-1]
MGQEFAIGAVVRDADAKRVGEVMDYFTGIYFLRPLGGGQEWSVGGESLSLWTRADQLSAAVATVNATSRRGEL